MKHIKKLLKLVFSVQGRLRGFASNHEQEQDQAKQNFGVIESIQDVEETPGRSVATEDEGYTNPFGVDWFGDDPEKDTPHLLVYEKDPRYCATIDSTGHGSTVQEGDSIVVVQCDTADDRQLFFLEDEKRWRPVQNLDLCIGITGANPFDPEGYDLRVERCVLKNPRQRWKYRSYLYDEEDGGKLSPMEKESDPTQNYFQDFCVSYAGTNTLDDDGPFDDSLQLRALNKSCNRWARVAASRYNIGARYSERWAGDDPDDYPTILTLDNEQTHCIAVDGSVEAGAKLKLDLCDMSRGTKSQLWYISDRRRWRPASNLSLCVGASNAPDGAEAFGFQPVLETCNFPQKRQKWQLGEAEDRLCLPWASESGEAEICVGAESKEPGANIMLVGDDYFAWRFRLGDSGDEGSVDSVSGDDNTGSLVALERDQNYCMAALGLSEGSELIARPCNGMDQQQLWLYEKGDDVLLRPATSKGLCVGISGASLLNAETASGFRPKLEQCQEGNSRQVWVYWGGYIAPSDSRRLRLSYINSPGLPDMSPIQMYRFDFDKTNTNWVLLDPDEYEAPGYDEIWERDEEYFPHLLVLRDDRSLCVAVEKVASGQYLHFRNCDPSSLEQLWRLNPDGQEKGLIRSGGDSELCVGIVGVEGTRTVEGYQKHPARPQLERCTPGNQLLMWTFEAGFGSWERSGIIRPSVLKKHVIEGLPAGEGNHGLYLWDKTKPKLESSMLALFAAIDPSEYEMPGPPTSNFLTDAKNNDSVLVVVESKAKICIEESTESESGFMAARCDPDSDAQRWKIRGDTILTPTSRKAFYYNNAWNNEVSREGKCFHFGEPSRPVDLNECGRYNMPAQRFLVVQNSEYRYSEIVPSIPMTHTGYVQIRSNRQDLCLLNYHQDGRNNGVRIGTCYWDVDKYDLSSKEQSWYVENSGEGYFRLRPRRDLTQCLSFGLLSVFQDVPSLTLGLCTDSDTQRWRYNKDGKLTISHDAVPGYKKEEFCVGWYVTEPPRYNEPRLLRCGGRDIIPLQWQFIDLDLCGDLAFSDTDSMVVLKTDPSKCLGASKEWCFEHLSLVECNKNRMSQIWSFESGGQWRAKYDTSYCVGKGEHFKNVPQWCHAKTVSKGERSISCFEFWPKILTARVSS